MINFIKSSDLKTNIMTLKKEGKSIGFVPTMGALHKGHLELVKRAKKETDVVVCSIFVNPLQFNKKKDLDTYPNRMEEDTQLLKGKGCDILFTPEKEDLFARKPDLDYDFGMVGSTMEGVHRPGHFEGVAAVIKRFFEIIAPTKAYFGEKDFQQLTVIKWLVEKEEMEVDVVGCSTVRNTRGLALSSRNLLLTRGERAKASEIYQTLLYCRNNLSYSTPEELAKRCFLKLQRNFKPEYFVIADESSLTPLKKWEESNKPRAFVAAQLSGIRLIDNLSLIN